MRYRYKQYHRRKLPHIHSPGAVLFITFRLAGSVPRNVLKEWRSEKLWLEKEIQKVDRENSHNTRARTTKHNAQIISHKKRLLDFHRRWFKRFEDILHQAATGPTWLKDDSVARIVADALHHRDGKVYRLDAYSIMPNHVHVVFKPFLNEKSLHEKRGTVPLLYESDEPPLDVIMHSLKSFTAQEANRVLKRNGSFWEAESYDHEIRNEAEYHRVIEYVLNNPVKAGLVKDRREWRWSWKRESRTGCQPVLPSSRSLI